MRSRSPIRSRPQRILQLLACIGAIAGSTTLRADDPASVENQVKAGCILNFIQFTDFPEGTFAKPDDPIVIGVIDPFPPSGNLVAAVEGKTIKGRNLVVRHFPPDHVGACHVLLLGSANGQRAGDVLKSASGFHPLTIGDSDNFTDAGGIIRMYLEDRKIHFEINLTAANDAHLQISSRLLKLAKVINR